MSYISAFDPSADKKRNLASKIYDISESVTKFFWDDAPRLGIQQREGQQDMAFDVLDAIKSGSHVVIEAGVGIGKSFAYLVPILLYNAKTFSPVVIATSTIALQEQLLSDVERLKKWLRIEPDLILAKGKNHYLCFRRASEYFQSVDGSAQAQIISDIRAGHQDRRSFRAGSPAYAAGKGAGFHCRRLCPACHGTERRKSRGPWRLALPPVFLKEVKDFGIQNRPY